MKKAFAKAQRIYHTGPQPPASKPCWSNAMDFVGPYETEFDGQQCWKAVGQIRVIYLEVLSKITAYLEEHSEPLAVGVVLLTLRMIGATPETAIPTVIFCCKDEHHRTTAMKAIKKSCILDDYPGLALKNSPHAPKSTDELVMMSGAVARNISQLSRQNIELGVSRPTRSETSSSRGRTTGQRQLRRDSPKQILETVAVPIFSEGFSLGSGSPLLTEGAKMAREGAQATIGGLIRVHGQSYIMTAAHPFAQVPSSPQIRNRGKTTYHSRVESDPENNWPSNGKDQNHCEDPEVAAARLSAVRHTSTHLRIFPYEVSSADFESFSLPQQVELLLPIGNLWFSSMVESASRPQLDYALIAPTESAQFRADFDIAASPQFTYLQYPKFASKEDLQHTVNTQAYTKAASSSVANGELDPMPAFVRMPNIQKYQEVYSVQFSHALAQGDCGAWVLDSFSQSLLGHIVAGSPEDGLAYIVPFYQVAEDMKRVLRLSQNQRYDPSANTPYTELHVRGISYNLRDPEVEPSDDSKGMSTLESNGYDPSADSTYTKVYGRGISHDGRLSPTILNTRGPGPYDAVGYIRRDGSIHDKDEIYEEYRPHNPYHR